MFRSPALVVIVLALMTPMVAVGQQVVDDVISALDQIASTDAGQWRFQHPAQRGGQAPGLDDSAWPLVRAEHRWMAPDSEAWYRKTIVIPDTVGGVPVRGSKLVLHCAIDDDMEIFINGVSGGKFHWDEGQAVLSEGATPGEEIVVAIRAINGPSHGRLLWAHLQYEMLADFREPAGVHRDRLRFCRRLLSSERIADRRGEYEKTLDDGAAKVDFEAIARGDEEAFAASTRASIKALRPFADLAKQYTLYLVGHAHIDMNWLWLWPETKQVCRQTWDQALKFADEFADFRFTQSQPGAYMAIEQESPELFERIQQAVARGQWEPAGASWVEGDTNMASGEILARQCLLAHEYYMDRLGRRSATAWLPDNFGHAWTVPSIFADAGYKYFYFCRAGKGIPTFWWEGPDGARLLAYNHRWYNEQFRMDRQSVPLEIEDAVGVPACMIVYGVGDHGGGPTREDIEAAKALQDEPLFPTVKFAKSSEYFEAALKHSGGDLPVIGDELNTTFEGCYTSHADIKKWNRDSENILPTAEALATIARRWTDSYPAEGLTQAWRNACFNQFHDILPGTAIHGSYDYSRELYEQTRQIADKAIDSSLEALCAQIDTRGEGQAFVVWNPVAWDREEYVELTLPSAMQWPQVVVTDSGGASRPAQVLDSAKEGEGWQVTVQFIAELPAMGYEVFHASVGPGSARAPDLPQQTAELSPQGEIFLRWDGDDGKPITVDAGLEILHEGPDGMSAWNIGPLKGTERPQLAYAKQVADGPVCKRLAAQYTYGKSTFDLTVTRYEALGRVEFDLVIDWQELGNGEEGGPFLKAGFRMPGIDNPLASFEIPWGSIERGANGHEVPGQKWVDIADAQRVIPPDGRQAKAIDVSAYFDEDVISGEGAQDGDFDQGRRAYAAEGFAAGGTIQADGVPFILPPTAPGAKNCIRARGQTIEWPAEGCPALAIFGASSNGRHGGQARLLYSDGSEQGFGLQFSDWCVPGGPGEAQALTYDGRIEQGRPAPPRTYVWLKRIKADPEKTLKGIALPDEPNLHVFGLAFAEHVEYKPTWGVSLLNDSKYGFDVKGNVMRMSVIRASYSPDPTPNQGVFRVRYALRPHSGGWRQAQTPRRAYEFNNRPIVRLVTEHAGTLPARHTFVRVEPETMILSALKLAQNGDDCVARVYNSTGPGGQARILCNLPFSTATACNLLEEERADTALAEVEGPVVTLDLDGRIHGTVMLRR